MLVCCAVEVPARERDLGCGRGGGLGGGGGAGGGGTAAAAEVTRVLVLPLARRVWLFHAGGAGAAERARRAEELRRIRGWGPRELAGRLEAFGGREVERLQAAAPGTFRGWLWKWAQALQTRIDPRETTLRGVPRPCPELRVTYPASLAETLVRRRLRLLAGREAAEKQCTYVWGAALFASTPLLVLPVSNLPLYWAFYRGYCHYAAWKGGGALREKLGSGVGAPGVHFEGSGRLDALLGESDWATDDALDAMAKEHDMPDLKAHFRQAQHQLKVLQKREKNIPPAPEEKED